MHRRARWNESGVSEVIGTILILAMTVVLFASIIIWVANIPTPQASIRTEMDGTLTPIFDDTGAWDGVNITIQHKGGETLFGWRSEVILSVESGGSISTTNLKTRGSDAGVDYGLIDGNNDDWDVGERWSYTNYTVGVNDVVTIYVVDTVRALVAWSETLIGPEGVYPPLFLEKWADRFPMTPTIDIPLTNLQFTIFARVTDPDGDLNSNSVYVYLAFLYGTPQHRAPQRMYDDGTNGDALALDGIYTASYTFFKPTSLTWDGGIVLFNATDLQGHRAESRMVLEVQEGPPLQKKEPGGFGDGRPPNLNYNGLQGFNIFNGTEWDTTGFNATETRTFRESEEVVVVVGSAILKDTFGRNTFILYDPFSSLPLDPVVYGTDKRVTATSNPSSTQAFEFLLYVNGYNIWVYRFELNNASTVGVNFKTNPLRPPEYFFGSYPLEFDIIDFLGNRFFTTDTITIMSDSGQLRNYPKLETFRDSGFTEATSEFSSTDVVYARITMRDVDGSPNSVTMGNVIIQDFLGGLQVFRAPANGRDANAPICPITGACTGTAININNPTVSYRFAVNLSLANQDPWIEGAQHYSFRVASILDSNEEYSLVLSLQLLITSPLYRMDLAVGNGDTQNNAWGTHDVSYYFLARNGVDLWSQERIHSGASKTIDYTKAISYLDFDSDQDLDVVASVTYGAGQPSEVFLYRQDVVGGDIFWTRSSLEVTGNVLVNDIRTGSLNKDISPEIVVGASNGYVWYYKNDGSWTKTTVDSPTTGQRANKAVNAVDLGDFDGDGDIDIAVARDGGLVTYYPNLDGFGRFTTNAQTDYWHAETEDTQKGQITLNSYLSTREYPGADDNVYEQIEERTYSQPATWINRTAQSDHYTNPGQRTSGTYVTTQTQDDAVEVITETTTTGTRKALTHIWTMTLPTSGTKTFYLDAYRNSGADDSFTFAYSTDNTTFTNLVTVTATSDTDTYLTASIPGSVSGLVYIRVTDSQQNNGEVTDSIRVDHMYVETFYAAGQVSMMEHYWRVQTLPNRPGSTYTFYIRAYRTDTGTEGDNFQFAYSTGGQFGAYTDVVLVNQAAETLFSATMPATVGGQTPWIRVIDTDRTAGRTQWAILYVDIMYIEVFTPAGITGSDINLAGDASNVIAMDAGNYDGDADVCPLCDDVFVGTAGGNVFRLHGSSGGLQPPGGTFLTGLGTIGGIKIGNVTMAYAGLEVAVASGTSVRIYRSDTPFMISQTSAVPNGKTITTLTMGDVDGDGDDDLIVGTDGQVNSAANVVYYRNMVGTSWTRILINDRLEAKIWDADLGDMNKAQYVGR